MNLPLLMRAEAPHLALLGVEFLVTPEGALYEPGDGLLIVADLHLEKGSAHAARGRFVPPYDTRSTLARLGAVIARLAPRTVICLGDSFENNGGPGRIHPEDRESLAGLQRLRDWIWLAGNHDPAPPAGVGGTAAAEIVLGPLTLRHAPTRAAPPGEIAGHLHPVAVVRASGGAVRRRCVACDGRRAVLPAFGAYAGGLDLRDAAFTGLFDRSRFVAFVLGDRQVWPVPAARCL